MGQQGKRGVSFLAVGCGLLLGICVLACVVLGVLARMGERQRAESDAAAAAAAAAQHVAAVRTSAPATIAAARATLLDARAKIDAGQWADASLAANRARATVAEVLRVTPADADALAVSREADALAASADELASLSGRIDDARDAITRGPRSDALGWDQGLAVDVGALRAASPAALARLPAITTVADQIDHARARQAPRVARARAQAEREQAAAEREHAAEVALEARCGAAPVLSAWDGEIIGSESFLAESANDPDSIDVEHCSVPQIGASCWTSVCDVRGRNAFGALVLNQYRFTVMQGEVVSAHRL